MNLVKIESILWTTFLAFACKISFEKIFHISNLGIINFKIPIIYIKIQII